MENGNSKSEQKVIIFPALISETVSEDQICFLFSARQVEDIVRDRTVYPVPFSPRYTEGLAEWREHVLPVISPERFLGLEKIGEDGGLRLLSTRLMVVRSFSSERGEERIMLRVAPTIRMISLPHPCTPLPSAEWIPRKERVKGIFEWEEGYLLLMDVSSLFGN